MKVDQAISRYIELRDEKTTHKKTYDDAVAEIDVELKKIEAMFLKAFNKSGQTSAKSKGIGVAFTKTRTSDKVIDRDAYLAFVVKSKRLEFLESRVAKSALDQYIEENDDLPPGVTRTSEIIVQIRRGDA